jgi:methylated-DNA-[protein]-cysteine S-methyltransferase
MLSPQLDTLVVFPSELGWMAMIGSGSVLKHLSFGHANAGQAVGALDPQGVQQTEVGDWNSPLMRQLQAFAAGERVDFADVEVELSPVSAFRRRVLEICRRIPYGKTLTYGQLAARAGSPDAARAVGACMAANRTPLVIPCHRVVGSSGGLGGFSAPGGLGMKRRLLELEAGLSLFSRQMD